MNKGKPAQIRDMVRNTRDEESLLDEFRNGDDSAFALIYNKYANELLSYGTGLGFETETLKDTIHDIFCKLYANKDSLKKIQNLKYYLFRALKNSLINLRKTQASPLDISGLELSFSVTVTVLDELIQDEDRDYVKKEVEKYLNLLTSRQREAIYLRFIQELSYEEIATLLDMSPHAVRKLTSRAILRIRKENLPVYLLLASLHPWHL